MNTKSRELDPQGTWLVVDALQRDPDNPKRVRVDLSVGGHPQRMVLDFPTPQDVIEYRDIIRYVETPWMPGHFGTAMSALVRLASRFYDGEEIVLPVDLSAVAAADIPPKPDPAEEQRLSAAADKVRLEVDQLTMSGSYPVLCSARLRVDGIGVDVRYEVYDSPGRINAGRWLHISNPMVLSATQWHAVRRMLTERAQAKMRDG